MTLLQWKTQALLMRWQKQALRVSWGNQSDWFG